MDYTASNSTTNPKIAYAGRLAGDPANTFSQGEQVLIAGAGTQVRQLRSGTCTRWGDYSGMALDPDGCRFWMTAEYYAVNGLNHHTRIGSFKYPGCTTVGNGTLSGTVTAGGNPVAGAKVRARQPDHDHQRLGRVLVHGAGRHLPVDHREQGRASPPAPPASIAVPSGGTATQDFALVAPTNPGCFTDNSQSAFQTGDPAGCDLNSSPGSVKLAPDAGVDQSNTNVTNSGFGFTSTDWAGQTFVPGKTGKVTKVALDLFCSGVHGHDAEPHRLAPRHHRQPARCPPGADLATGDDHRLLQRRGRLLHRHLRLAADGHRRHDVRRRRPGDGEPVGRHVRLRPVGPAQPVHRRPAA